MEPVEERDFYYSIRGMLFVLKLCGGRIQRPLSEQTRAWKYYSLNIYCTLCNVITFVALIKLFFVFGGGFSVETGNIFLYLIIALGIAIGAIQLGSILSYHKILPFWDSVIAAMPQKFNQYPRRSKIVLNLLLMLGLVFDITMVTGSYYFILIPDPDHFYMRLAEPWSDTLKASRISVMVTGVCFLPALLAWTFSSLLFLTGAYYLRTGFVDLYKAMDHDPQLITGLSTHRRQHLRLVELTATLDYILRTYIGGTICMAMFDMCFVIFTLGHHNSSLILAGSVFVLLVALITLVATAVISISVNSWVTIFLRRQKIIFVIFDLL